MKNNPISACGVVVMAAIVCGLVGSACAQKQENPYADYSVLVESFVVELTAQAVREAGADIVGRDPADISVTKLLRALRDAENGRVVSGLKVDAGHGQRNVGAKQEITQYFSVTVPRRQGPPESAQQATELRPYSSSKDLSIEWFNIINANSVRLGYSYSENTVIPSVDDAPPAIANTVFTGSVTVTPGVPVIAGAAQDDEMVRLLLFVVTLKANDTSDADDTPAVTLSPEQVKQTLEVYFAGNTSIASFTPLETGEPILRADGRTAIPCTYELTYWDKERDKKRERFNQLVFFHPNGKVSAFLHLEPRVWIEP